MVSLRRRPGSNPHVSEFRSTPGGLDQEPRTAIPISGTARAAARAGILLDRSQCGTQPSEYGARSVASGSSMRPALLGVVRDFLQANPPRPLPWRRNRSRASRPAAFLRFTVTLEIVSRPRQGLMEGAELFRPVSGYAAP